ncbi:MAG: phosphoribosylaminoimidazolesuccinocarboxamide synthase [Bacteroidales bacterium]|nr:phosphoribosylaminoimidazolesuccinocarboxamide synthase [Bacteroidales bacterium]MBR3500148.1 phosphoribosylaminoimidazolesuccinocarboxamide synthase [Bacteroidales bacterium]MCR4910079.1 phosphoribosylaminoimidazolesuccinocarboxamide synthase [Bacteroidales bacterium]
MKKDLIFEGNEKRIYADDNPHQVVFHFNDVVVAYNGVKRARLKGKGILTNKISSFLLGHLNDCGVPTHFIERLDDREQLCRKIEIIPLEVVVHNRMAGTLAAKLGVEDGFKPVNTIVDLCYNNDELGDPLVNRDQAVALGLASYEDLDKMLVMARRAGSLLTELFHKAGIELVDAKIEFGRASDTGEIIISDEISPDTCRLWDEETQDRLDKDRFRLDLGDVVPAYTKVLERLESIQ